MSQQHRRRGTTQGWGRWYPNSNPFYPVPGLGYEGTHPEIPVPPPQYGCSSSSPPHYSYCYPEFESYRTRCESSRYQHPSTSIFELWRRVGHIESQIDNLQDRLQKEGKRSRECLDLLFASLYQSQSYVDTLGRDYQLMLGEQMVLQDPLAPGDLNALSSRLDVLREQWVTERMAILRPMIDFEWARATEESTWEELRLLKVELIEVYHRLERRARRE